jgi:hypothetical protein
MPDLQPSGITFAQNEGARKTSVRIESGPAQPRTVEVRA